MLANTTISPLAQDEDAPSGYASKAQTAAILQSGLAYRRRRLEESDMITTDKAAELAGTTRVTINAWIKSGRCIGLSGLTRGYKLPAWQFEPYAWPAVQCLSKRMGTTDGWQLLSFLESPIDALDGVPPVEALSQGVKVDRILQLAQAEAH